MHLLRNTPQNRNNQFLFRYFHSKALASDVSNVSNYQPGDNINDFLRMSANTLMKTLVSQFGKYNIKVISDMDPALQKAARNQGVPEENRLDQQNHAILLNTSNPNSNLEMKNAVLSKVLGGRGENISHKGNGVNCAMDVEKTIYIYAHKKTPIIGSHILNRIKSNDTNYRKKMFIFCGPGAVGKFNAMHLAYLMDADGITTSGAGTSGEFVYLHKVAGARSNLLSLPIEGHNEQEAITDALFQYPSIKENVFKLGKNEALEEGRTIDKLVKKPAMTESDHVETYQKFISALSDNQTYVGKVHDILFRMAALDKESSEYQNIQRVMYESANLKGVRYYLKLVFQTFNYLTESSDPFPVTIKFKESSPGETFNSLGEVVALLADNKILAETLGLPDSEAVTSLPLIREVKQLITSGITFSSSEGKHEFDKLKEKFGHHMTTGF